MGTAGPERWGKARGGREEGLRWVLSRIGGCSTSIICPDIHAKAFHAASGHEAQTGVHVLRHVLLTTQHAWAPLQTKGKSQGYLIDPATMAPLVSDR